MKRLEGESFEDYKERRKQAGKMTEEQLKGTMVHCSALIVETQPGVFRKYRAGGTVRKETGLPSEKSTPG